MAQLTFKTTIFITAASAMSLAPLSLQAEDKAPFTFDVPSMVEQSAKAGISHSYQGPW